jgi:hypothetical protein
MFALPFFFLLPGAFFGVVGAVLLYVGRRLRPTDPALNKRIERSA